MSPIAPAGVLRPMSGNTNETELIELAKTNLRELETE
jgi:hypothetical protein